MADIEKSGLYKNIEGIQEIRDALVVLIRTEWNAVFVDELEQGCVNTLKQNEIKTKTVVVPGAVEIPFAIQHYWRSVKKKERPQAFIALGCVIRGDTPHFEYVCQSVTYGITQLNTRLPVPVIFGVLTVNTEEQARQRLGGEHGHKGEEAALTAIKMLLFNHSF
ncbi:MAG: 6,7-dimethyl-8-ribityllumazine synthase [Flavisolibacter sp.]|nr:6,7-dimethyl-8-ribityllumazine synthase [Flavisolibacter sp.]MBD0351119.1 6,7-dimethyl-8-ribityllumazine synthase [Flavisolibacter sp.]